MALYRTVKHTPRGHRSDREKFLTRDELQQLLTSVSRWKNARARRDYALLFTCAMLGLRVGELVELRAENLSQLGDRLVWIRSLKKRGELKGRPETVAVTEEAQKFLLDYARGLKPSDWLFPSPFIQSHISTRMVRAIFDYHCRRAGLSKRFCLHGLRHYAGVYLWQASHDLEFVRRQLRHQNIATTGIYMHMSGEEAVKKMAGAEPIGVAPPTRRTGKGR